jgi:exodeoxyribonuclease VII small subunit
MAKKTKISYNEAISQIEETIEIIENGNLNVDEISEKVKIISDLLDVCKNKLKKTEDEVEKIMRKIEDF